jgi:UDP-glucose 4-epimerase
MPTMLVTGGAGFIGSHLVEALVARGDRVRVLDNLSTGFDRNLAAVRDKVEVIEGSADDPAKAEAACQGVDIVFHEAALASVPRSIENPLETHAHSATATVVLLDAARRAGVSRFVYAASSSCYGDQIGDTKHEAMVPAPLSPYAAAKLTGELYCQAFYYSYGLETVALRYFNVFGPRQDPSGPYAAVIPLFIQAIQEGRQPVIYGDGLQTRDFTYIANIVHGNLLAAQTPGIGGRVFNLANGDSISLLDLLNTLNELLGTDVQPKFAPARVGDVKHSRADANLIKTTLGYEPIVGFREGLRRLLVADGLLEDVAVE